MPVALDRAREALEAAQVCLERHLPLYATSRAYYAIFWAAQVALAQIGIIRSQGGCLMVEGIQTLTSYRDRLDAVVTAFSHFIRDLCSEARLEISFVRYEDEDAHIWISLPPTYTPAEREVFANHVAEKSLDFLLEEGFLILAGIEEP